MQASSCGLWTLLWTLSYASRSHAYARVTPTVDQMLRQSPTDTPVMHALDSRLHVVACNTGGSPIYEGLPSQKRCRRGRRPTPEVTCDHCATAIGFV